jgi:hypothetical protein
MVKKELTPYGYRWVFFTFNGATSGSICTLTFVKPIMVSAISNGATASTQTLQVYFPIESQMPVPVSFTDNAGVGITVDFNSRTNCFINIPPRSNVTVVNMITFPVEVTTRAIVFRMQSGGTYGVGVLMKPFK